MEPVRIIHFSDILCIWTYIAQVRIDELLSRFEGNVEIEYRFFPVFGHTLAKFRRQWEGKGGLEGYSRHAHKIAGRFEHVTVNPDAWSKVVPRSSLPAHLYLNALKLAERAGKAPEGGVASTTWRLRRAFFEEAADIGARPVVRCLLEAEELPVAGLDAFIDSGEAYAALSEDMQLARDLEVSASPTLVFNNGRQRLTGNVGYRIIEANVRELIERPDAEHSWC